MADLTPPSSQHNPPQRGSVTNNAKAIPYSSTSTSSGNSHPTHGSTSERHSGDALDSPPTSDDDDLEERFGAGGASAAGEEGLEGMEYEDGDGDEDEDELEEEYSEGEGEENALQADASGDVDVQSGGGQAGQEVQAGDDDVMLIDDSTGGGGGEADETGAASSPAALGGQGQPAEGRSLVSNPRVAHDHLTRLTILLTILRPPYNDSSASSHAHTPAQQRQRQGQG
jgi:hypothetical protein